MLAFPSLGTEALTLLSRLMPQEVYGGERVQHHGGGFLELPTQATVIGIYMCFCWRKIFPECCRISWYAAFWFQEWLFLLQKWKSERQRDYITGNTISL